MASPRSSPFRGGMPKNCDSGGSSSETEGGMCLTLVEKKLRSTALKTKSKVGISSINRNCENKHITILVFNNIHLPQVFGRCGLCGNPITGEGQRVELAIPHTVNSKKFVVNYEVNGETKLHSQCWKTLQGVGGFISGPVLNPVLIE